MSRRIGIPVALLLLIGCIAAPVLMDASDAVGQSFYRSQLDSNGKAVFDSLDTLLGNYQNTVDVKVSFNLDGSRLFADEETAEDAAIDIVKDALAAKYYSEPLIPHLWDLPVKDPVIDVTVSTIIPVGSETRHYYVSDVTIGLSVPDDMKDGMATDVNEREQRVDSVKSAVKSIAVSGNNAEKAKQIASGLKTVKITDDGEGEVSNIYDALVSKSSSSAGVAAAFTSICMTNGVESVIVKGQLFVGEDSSVEYWNAVLDDGSWYAVDVVSYNSGSSQCMMAGSATTVSEDGSIRFSTTHVSDLDLSSANDLVAPSLSRDAYPYPDDTPFLEKYGSYILLAVIIVVISLAMIKAARSDN